MFTRFERLPNEILLMIFSNLSWTELLTSLWSLNKRLDFVIRSVLSRTDNKSNSGLVIIEPGLSFNICYSILFPILTNRFSSFVSCIRRIHFDGTNSNICDLSYEWLVDNQKNSPRFPNLKSLILTRCLLVESLFHSLSLLILYQLDELKLVFDEDMSELFEDSYILSEDDLRPRKLRCLLKELIRRLFSFQCRLTSLQLDIGCYDSHFDIYPGFTSRNEFASCSRFNQSQTCYPILRYLRIHLECMYYFGRFIDHVPALEKLFIYSKRVWHTCSWSQSDVETLIQSNANWFNKVPKLQCISLMTSISDDLELVYLNWFLNNLDHIKKLKIYLTIDGSHAMKNKSVANANFIRQYCMPDAVASLAYFDFYVSSKSKLLLTNDIDKIIHSFKIHPCFVDHQWTNVKCFFDPGTSYQHLSSSFIHMPRFSNGLLNRQDFFRSLNIRHVWLNLHPSLYLLLERLEELFPNAFCIKVQTEFYVNYGEPGRLPSLVKPFEMGKCKPSDIQFRNITRLDFGLYPSRLSVRPDYKKGYFSAIMIPRWYESLQTPESIDKHVNVFKQDLYQLIEQMKELVFLDIHGTIHEEKVEPYRSMIQTCFPVSRSVVEIWRFRLWL